MWQSTNFGVRERTAQQLRLNGRHAGCAVVGLFGESAHTFELYRTLELRIRKLFYENPRIESSTEKGVAEDRNSGHPRSESIAESGCSIFRRDMSQTTLIRIDSQTGSKSREDDDNTVPALA